MDTVYITGHKNPDSDSIIAAMSYAALKNALGERQYVAARLGGVSDETQIILDRFHAQPPMLLNNVRNQVRVCLRARTTAKTRLKHLINCT